MPERQISQIEAKYKTRSGTAGKVMNRKVTVLASGYNFHVITLHLGTPCYYSVPQGVSFMLRHSTECIAVQLVKLMCWPSRAKVKSGAPYGISLWSTRSDVCQMLVCLHIIVTNGCMLALNLLRSSSAGDR